VTGRRIIATIADGSTDHEIIYEFIRRGVTRPPTEEGDCGWQHVPLRQNVHQGIRDHVRAAGQEGYTLCGRAALALRGTLLQALLSARADLEAQAGRHNGLRATDLIVLSSDAEETVPGRSGVVTDPWAITLAAVVHAAIDDWQDKSIEWGLDPTALPLVVPFVPFPSTDVLVAAAKGVRDLRGRRGREMKRDLYGVEDLSQLRADDLSEKALRHFGPQTAVCVCREVPEARDLLRPLLFAQAPA